MNDQLTQLLSVLDARQAQIGLWDQYYNGEQPLAYLSPEAKAALGTRFGRMASNIPRLAVTSLAERLRVAGFTGDGAEAVWAAWLRCDSRWVGRTRWCGPTGAAVPASLSSRHGRSPYRLTPAAATRSRR